MPCRFSGKRGVKRDRLVQVSTLDCWIYELVGGLFHSTTDCLSREILDSRSALSCPKLK